MRQQATIQTHGPLLVVQEVVASHLIRALTVALLCAGCASTPEIAKPSQRPAEKLVRAGGGCAPRVAFCVMIEDDPVIHFDTEKSCNDSLEEMRHTVELHLHRNMIPGPYLIDTLCGDHADIRNYESYLRILAEQLRVQIEGTKKGGGV